MIVLNKPKFWDQKEITIWSILLLPLTIVVKIYNKSKLIISKKHRFSIPIICIGNIYLGGTGKTPLAIEMYKLLKLLNKNPGFVRKYYKSFQDEHILLKKHGEVFLDKDRKIAINKLVENKKNVAILDDGFQDLSINKNLSIVCFNEKQWIGNGQIIPAGPLRENLHSLKRADYVFINGKKNLIIENKILEKNEKIKIYYTKYKALNIDDLKNIKVLAFAGIGNPDNFFDLIEYNNIKIFEKISFPDHYNYSHEKLTSLIDKAIKNKATLLTTEKDFLRISGMPQIESQWDNYKKNIKVLKIKLEIENKNEFLNEIKKMI